MQRRKQDGGRGAFMTPNRVYAGWMTHKLGDNYTSQTHRRVLSPMSGSPAWGFWQWEEEPLENMALKANGVSPQEFHS